MMLGGCPGFSFCAPAQQGFNLGHAPRKAATDSHRAKCAILKACPCAKGLRFSVQIMCSGISWNRGAGYLLQRREVLICDGFHCVTSFVICEASQSLTAYFGGSMRHVLASIYAALRAGIRHECSMTMRYARASGGTLQMLPATYQPNVSGRQIQHQVFLS